MFSERFRRTYRSCAAVLCAAGILCGCAAKKPNDSTTDNAVNTAPHTTASADETTAVSGADALDPTAVTTENASASAETSEGAQTTASVPDEVPPPTPIQDTDAAALDAIFNSYGTTGAQVAVIKNGAVSAVYSYGTANRAEGVPVTEDTKYRCASLSKLVTDMVFMRLTESGVVSETEDIGTYLGYRVRNPYFPGTAITPRMLMTHTSTLIDSSAFLDSRLNGSSVPLRTLLTGDACFAYGTPGESYRYSNFGVAVLGCVCEKAMDTGFETLAKLYLLDPIGIDAAYTAKALKDPSLIGTLYGSGGMSVSSQMALSFCSELGQTHHLVQGNLTISAKDYAKILCVLLNNGKSGGTQVLTPQSVDAILENRADDRGRGIGYGTEIIDSVIPGETYYVHTGSNFGMYSAYAFSPDRRDGAVVLTSGAYGSADGQTEIYNVCLDAIREVLK